MHSTIQDGGRFGLAFYGIPQAGYMDSLSANLGNSLVGNAAGSAVIECTYTAPTVEFGKNFIIAITGANMGWTIDKNPIPRYTSLYVRKGSVLEGSHAREGVRSYIAIQGDMKIDEMYGSRSYYGRAKIGGIDGQVIEKGDRIPFVSRRSKWEFRYVPDEERPKLASRKTIPIRRGPEWHLLDQQSKESMMKDLWTLGSESDRMGAYLINHGLSYRAQSTMRSVPVFPGIIQAPADGNPIVVLQDGQTTGGYPRIAYIPQASLGLFNQIRPQEPFNFYLVLEGSAGY